MATKIWLYFSKVSPLTFSPLPASNMPLFVRLWVFGFLTYSVRNRNAWRVPVFAYAQIQIPTPKIPFPFSGGSGGVRGCKNFALFHVRVRIQKEPRENLTKEKGKKFWGGVNNFRKCFYTFVTEAPHERVSARRINQHNKDMERYDYRRAICEDIFDYIKRNHIKVTEENREELQDELNDKLWIEDSVTGNGSGSYTCNRDDAAEYLCHNLDLLGEALQEFGCGMDYLMKQGVEACDVTIRCYLLGECLDGVLEELAKVAGDEEEGE